MEKAPKIVILNQQLVREKLRQKKYDDVCLSSWGNLDEFIEFITSLQRRSISLPLKESVISTIFSILAFTLNPLPSVNIVRILLRESASGSGMRIRFSNRLSIAAEFYRSPAGA